MSLRNPVVHAIATFLVTAVASCPAFSAFAQEMLPRPDEPFKGHFGRTAKDSRPDFRNEVTPRKNAPNILLILTVSYDDDQQPAALCSMRFVRRPVQRHRYRRAMRDPRMFRRAALRRR